MKTLTGPVASLTPRHSPSRIVEKRSSACPPSAGAKEAARTAVAYLGEEERWALLQRWLEQEPARQRRAGQRSPRLEALRSILCPRVSDRTWDEVVREGRPMLWADELRRANALACQITCTASVAASSPHSAPSQTKPGTT